MGLLEKARAAAPAKEQANLSKFNYSQQQTIKGEPVQQPPSDIPPLEQHQDYKKVEYPAYTIKKRYKWYSIKGIIDKIKIGWFPDKTVVINMELRNGFFRRFIVVERKGCFFYRGNQYIFDQECRYYSIDDQLWCYDYHEDYSLPIKRKIPIGETKKLISSSSIQEIEYMTNPSVVEKFTKSKIIEAIMKGAELDAFMRQLRLMMIITMIAGIIHLLLFMYKTGMFKQIAGSIPGLG